MGKLGLYLGGATDEFEVTVRAGEHGAEMVAEVKSLILGSDYYDYVFDGLVAPEIEDALAGELPLGLEVTASRVESSARVVAPREWVHTQMEAAIDEVAPYALGYNDYFEIRVALSDRAPIAVEEVKELLRELDAYKVLYDEVIEPAFTETLGEHVELQFDIVITRDETVSSPPADRARTLGAQPSGNGYRRGVLIHGWRGGQLLLQGVSIGTQGGDGRSPRRPGTPEGQRPHREPAPRPRGREDKATVDRRGQRDCGSR